MARVVAKGNEMLEDHRLQSFETYRVRDRFPRFVSRNAKGNPQKYGGSIQVRVITTDQGMKGWGSSHVPDEEIKPLIGERMSDLIDPDVGTSEHASTLDLPLHDLAGKILGQPVYKMLGGKGSRHVPIYSGSIYFDDLEPEDSPRGVAALVASCQQDYEAGYRAFKLKIGRGFKWMDPETGMQRDIEAVRAVSEAFPDCKVLVDANDSYTCDGFIRFLDGVADCDLYWIEEPFEEGEEDLTRLKDHMAKIGCRALIAEGEAGSRHARAEGASGRPTEPTAYGYYPMWHIDHLYKLAEKGLVDVFIIDLGIVGFTRWRTVMPELVAAGVPASPHTWAWCVRPRYASHLAAGSGNVVIVEGIPGESSGLDYSNYTMVDGSMVVPDLPGWGIPIDEGGLEAVQSSAG